jgi:hypothetical protein
MQLKDLIDHAEKSILAAQKAEEALADHSRAVEEAFKRLAERELALKSAVAKVAGIDFLEAAERAAGDPHQAVLDEIERLCGRMLTPGLDFQVPPMEYLTKKRDVHIRIERLIINVGDPQPKNEKGE